MLTHFRKDKVKRDKLHTLSWVLAALVLAGGFLFSALAAQGPTPVDMPRPTAITFLPTWNSDGTLAGLTASITALHLEASPSGKIEKKVRTLDLDLVDTAGKEVGTGRARTTHKQIGEDVIAMAVKEWLERYPAPLPLARTTP